MDLSEEQKAGLMELQALQQQLQSVLMQKQQLQAASAEFDRALEAVKAQPQGKFYRFAGAVLVPRDAASLEKELSEEKQLASSRIESFSKFEEKLRQRASEVQKKLEKPAARNG
ncbi:MAG: prefoldin subunit [Candidatus Micrarchaeota archaeon]